MKKTILTVLLAMLILSGCSGEQKKQDGTDKTETETVKETVSSDTVSDETESETVAVTIPPMPEEGVSVIPDAEIKYSDDKLFVQVDPEGSSYANGQQVNKAEADNMIYQVMAEKVSKKQETTPPENLTTTAKEPAVITPETSKVTNTAKVTTSVKETTVTVPAVTEDLYEDIDIVSIGKYNDTGKTKLAIKDIEVYNNSQPGAEGVIAYKPGDTMLINLWCDNTARLDSIMYIVPEETEHKSSYSKNEYIYSTEMLFAMETGENQIFIEVELPKGYAAGTYELRFVCGTEEGFFPFVLEY